MIATFQPPFACTVVPHVSNASFELPVPLVRDALDVLDGLVSIGHQAWRCCAASSVLQ